MNIVILIIFSVYLIIHFFQNLLIKFWLTLVTLLTNPFRFYIAWLLGFSYSLLKNAELEIEVEPENLFRFCLRVTLLNIMGITQLKYLWMHQRRYSLRLIFVWVLPSSSSPLLQRVILVIRSWLFKQQAHIYYYW